MRGKYKKEDHNITIFFKTTLILAKLAGSKKSCFKHKFYWLPPHKEITVTWASMLCAAAVII